MPIDYTFETFNDLRLPQPLNADVAASMVKHSDLTSADVVFAAGGGTDAERHALTWLLATYVPQPYKKATNHQILPLTAASVGQVVLAYDANRRATATLVGRGLPAGLEPPYREPAQLTQWLKDTYALAGITGQWTGEQLIKLHTALGLVPEADRPALRGVLIQRVAALQSQDGHDKGKFSYERGPWAGSLGTLKLADAIFAEDGIGFFGGLTSRACLPSVRGILHEVGHAVESASCRNEARNNAAWVVESTGGRQYRAPEHVPDNLVTEAIQLDTDNEALGELGTGLPNATARAEFDTLCDTIEKIQSWITSAENGTFQQEGVFSEVKSHLAQALTLNIWQTYRQEIVRWCDAQIREARWRTKFVTPRGNNITPCLRDFVQFVHDGGVGTNLTPYAQTSYGELFAEAYSFWLADPDAVERHDRRLRQYFDRAAYRVGD
ncbi:hypothetical protein ACFFV7_36900 [Nonomuraea spiralis]|uniref:Uncharacterized protein n=1 Tax=Nonomuraea spiralis TaxID=46182 RepID=A0ABV5IQL8_9ACTN|nr:hypothetical protein [Nonomuraea spiralis]GGT38053.1 hypothetical protein GCM10010176_097750 [Nonomuraea spiralis]